MLAQSVTAASRNASTLDIADQTRLSGSRYSGIRGLENEDALSLGDGAQKCAWIPYPIRHSIGEMIDISMLKDPVLVLMCISNIVCMLSFYVPLVFIIDLAVSRGSTVTEATSLLLLIGAANTIGRVFFGWMADRRWLSALTISNLSLLICGLLTTIVFVLQSYLALCVYAATFGFVICECGGQLQTLTFVEYFLFSAAFISLTSIVLSDLLGVDRLTNSFGLLIVSRGLASLVGTPLAGCVYDLSGSYDAMFVVAGWLVSVGGDCKRSARVCRRRRVAAYRRATEAAARLVKAACFLRSPSSASTHFTLQIVLASLIGCLVAFFHRRSRSQLKNEGEDWWQPSEQKKRSLL